MVNPDYAITARDLASEVPADQAPFYQGIHLLELNQIVRICFVPPFEGVDGRSVYPPPDLNQITSANDARLAAVWQWDYLITPARSPARRSPNQLKWNYATAKAGDAGALIAIRENSGEKRRRALFFVSNENFTLFTENLRQIESLPRNQLYPLHHTELKELLLVKYIENSVLSTLFIKQDHFAALSRPYESLIRCCVDLTLENNDAHNGPPIYHGTFNHNGGTENLVSSELRYEYALLPNMFCIPDERFIPTASQKRTFWSVLRSIEGRSRDFPWHFVCGVSLWQDGRDPGRLQMECFKAWRVIEGTWGAEVEPPSGISPTTIPDYTLELTGRLENIEPQKFARNLVRYVTGLSERPDFQ